ncbi:MAG: hypothetical protein JO312_08985 [Hyphomicrobiales bacterium]|nr:hypothetical protein [Hyphomicrobiales bacterium]
MKASDWGPDSPNELSALGLPPPKYVSTSAIEEAKCSRSWRPWAIVGGAVRYEHVRRADLNLLQDLWALTGCSAKKLNPEWLGIMDLRDYALGFIGFARLQCRLALR